VLKRERRLEIKGNRNKLTKKNLIQRERRNKGNPEISTWIKRLFALFTWINLFSFFFRVISSLKNKTKCFQYIPFTE